MIRSPDRPVAIPTTLPSPHTLFYTFLLPTLNRHHLASYLVDWSVNESINQEGIRLVSQFVVFELQLLRAHSITNRISCLSSVVVKVIYGWLGWPNKT